MICHWEYKDAQGKWWAAYINLGHLPRESKTTVMARIDSRLQHLARGHGYSDVTIYDPDFPPDKVMERRNAVMEKNGSPAMYTAEDIQTVRDKISANVAIVIGKFDALGLPVATADTVVTSTAPIIAPPPALKPSAADAASSAVPIAHAGATAGPTPGTTAGPGPTAAPGVTP